MQEDPKDTRAAPPRYMTEEEFAVLVTAMGAAPVKIILWAEDADTESYVRMLVEAAPSLISDLRSARAWKAQAHGFLLQYRACVLDQRTPDWRGEWNIDALNADLGAFLGERSDRETPQEGTK